MRARIGATLMEVLISILIMAIGVIGVATLFPLSLIHAVKGHQLTSGTIHRFNAEAFLDVRPGLLNPSLPGAAPTTPYMIDPLGIAEGMPTTVGAMPRLSPYSAQPAGVQMQLAELACTQPDSWDTIFTSTVTDQTNIDDPINPRCLVDRLGTSGIAVNNNGNPPADYVPPFPRMQAILFYDDPITGRRHSFVRNIWRIQTDQLELTRPIVPPVDATGTEVPLGEVRIQAQIRQFTWLLTVRPDPAIGEGYVDMVVFFKRSFVPAEDDQAYSAWFVRGDMEVMLRWNETTQPKPVLKRGSYILDSNGGYWYRILDHTPPQPSNLQGFTHQAVLTLNSAVSADSSPGATGNAVLMRGIVDVYPLGSKPLQ